MQRTVLARSGIEVSRIGLGLSRIHHLMFESDRARLIDKARSLGITHFDVARLYADGLAERSLGRAVRRVRSSVTIASKFGLLPNDWLGAIGSAARPWWAARSILRRVRLSHWPRRCFTADTMRRSLTQSLRLMQTDYIDVYFLHEPRLEDLAGNEELIDALLQAKKGGQVRALGLAGADVGMHDQFPGVFDVIQTAESNWDGVTAAPDFTYGVLSGSRKAISAEVGRTAGVRHLLQSALARRPQGAVLLGTSKSGNLDVVAGIDWQRTI
jgi:aryl-alcohol dehydrogenase-like predicted oxidoreductase